MPALSRCLLPALLLLANATLGEPQAATTLPADNPSDILARIRTAIGYDALARFPQGLTVSGKTTFLGAPATYELRAVDARHASFSIIGAISRGGTLNGAQIWMTDIGGEVRPAGASERDSILFELSILTYAYLDPKSPFQFELLPQQTTAEVIALKLSHPDARLSGTLVVDRATSVPRSFSAHLGSAEVTLTFADFTATQGLLFPRSIQNSADAGEDETIRIDAVTPIAAPADFSMPSTPKTDAAFDTAIPPEIEVVRSPTGHLLVHPLVNGKDVGWFIFDTGAGNSVLSTPVLQELGLTPFGTVSANGVGGKSAATFSRPATLSLGPVTLKDPLMVNLDLAFLEPFMKRKIAGLIGYNFIARCAARVDMTAATVSLYDPAHFADDPTINWQPLIIDHRIPHVPARFEDHQGLFALDTGAANSTLTFHFDAVQSLHLLDNRSAQDSKAGGVGGFVKTKKVTLASLELAGSKMKDVPAELATEPRGTFANPYVTGTLGGRILSQFTMLTDYPHNRIAFLRRAPATRPSTQPSPRPPDTDHP